MPRKFTLIKPNFGYNWNMESGNTKGHLSPITILKRQIASIFDSLGFSMPEGPEVETEYYNFDALNIPADHPARDMWDTFWIKNPKDFLSRMSPNDAEHTQKNAEKDARLLLRTHTSPVQVRYMETHQPPLAIVSIGKTYRYEATDATHETNFNQVEGLMVDKNISMANLKGVLTEFFKRLFEKELKVRFRPSYFPFVEPGLEVDLQCFKCSGNGCNVCKKTGWIEIMGAGMVHPKVLQNVKIDPRVYQGFAFGMGLERIAMLKYGIDDVRLLHSGDLRFIRQFK